MVLYGQGREIVLTVLTVQNTCFDAFVDKKGKSHLRHFFFFFRRHCVQVLIVDKICGIKSGTTLNVAERLMLRIELTPAPGLPGDVPIPVYGHSYHDMIGTVLYSESDDVPIPVHGHSYHDMIFTE